MIIVISGPQSSGKTTLINDLKNIKPNWIYFPEDARIFYEEIKKHGLDPISYGLHKWQLEICERNINTIKQAKKLSNKGHICVLDRSVLDCIIYTKLYVDKQFPEHDYIITQCKKYLPFIDIQFFTTPVSNLKKDGLRDHFEDYHQREVRMFAQYHRFGIVLPIDRYKRVSLILNTIGA